jgi:hypothetical protein
MFKKTKQHAVSSLLVLGVLSTFAEAAVPAAPGPYIGVTDINDTAVQINFLDNSNDETGFQIVGDINLVMSGANDGSVDSYVYKEISGLTCGTTYTIKALAYNADGNSSFSYERKFNLETTFGQSCTPVVVETPFPAGPYVGVTAIDSTSVRVSFLDNSVNETGFKIIGDINASIPVANDENVHPYVYKDITGLTCDKVYAIKAVAYNANGDALPTEERKFNIHTTFGLACN